MKNCLPIVVITMGDPVGIGPEIIHKALNDKEIYQYCRPIVTGDMHVLGEAGKYVKSHLKINRCESIKDARYDYGTIDLLSMSDLKPDDVRLGKPTKKTGKAMIRYIEKAIDMTLNNDVSAVITCPINKTAMKLAGSPFHGHTELFAAATDTSTFLMMMAGETLSVVLATIHIPFDSVKEALTTEKILETIVITGNALKERFGIDKPTIAVAGLNPHAGEEGLFGNEEETIIKPAVEEAIRQGFQVTGPFPPDTVFYHALKGRFDVVVAMYHDQGLIPFKMIHFEDGVNTTLGLPIIRTSVDHGTAYDLAGTGKADAGSLKSAIKLAARQAMYLSGASNLPS